jgi:hypothetical protein
LPFFYFPPLCLKSLHLILAGLQHGVGREKKMANRFNGLPRFIFKVLRNGQFGVVAIEKPLKRLHNYQNL